MRRVSRLAVSVFCVLLLVVVGVQGEGEGTWDEAIRLFDQAAGFQQRGLLSDAIALYEEALTIVRALEERYAEAVILNNLGLCHKDLGNFQQAIDLYQQSLEIKRELPDRISEAITLDNLGNCYYYLSDYDQAISLHEQALLIFEEFEDEIGIAKCLGNLGNAYHGQGEYQRAIDYHTQSLVIFRALDDTIGEVIALEGLGNCYRDLLDCATAISYYEQALAIHLELNNRDRAAECQDRIADCQGLMLATQALSAFEQHRHQDAMRLLEDALGIARRLELEAREWATLGLLGVGSIALGDYGRAIDYFEQALELSTRLADRAGQAADLNQLGACYRELSALDRARDSISEALAIYRELHDRHGEAGSLTNLGLTFFDSADYDLAVEYHEQALLLFRELGDASGEAACLTNLGICYMALSEYPSAVDCHQRSLEIEQVTGNVGGEAVSLVDLGDCYASMASYETALFYYLQSLDLAIDSGASGAEFRARWGLGRTYREIGQMDEALSHYESAIELVERTRDLVEDEVLRQSYFGSRRTLYEEYLELLLELGENDATIYVAERLRARTFLDALYQSGLAPEQLQLSETGINRAPDASLSVMDSEALEAAVMGAQGSLLPNEAVLEYMVGDDGIYLWILTDAQGLGPEFIPYAREQLLRDVVALRQAIEPQTRNVEGEPELYFADPSDALGQFYELLLQPALGRLGVTIDTLIFVPSGPLWYVPFAALVMTDQPEIEAEGTSYTPTYRPTYLIDRYTLAFLPSLASLPMLMEGDTPSTGSYLALANPTLSEAQQTAVGPDYQHEVLERACRAFAPYVGGDEADVYMQAEAQEALATRSATGQRVLMFACHGDFNPSVPLDSRLLLSPSKDEASGSSASYLLDGDYHASEVLLTDHTGVDLVVLAACETLLPTLREVEGALGLTLGPASDEALNYEQLQLIVAGDEVVGLSRAFLSSGAHSVLGTLWQASPTAIERLLISLGAGSQDGLSWAEALRQAQQEVIAHENYDDVWFWAPYQLIGRWR